MRPVSWPLSVSLKTVVWPVLSGTCLEPEYEPLVRTRVGVTCWVLQPLTTVICERVKVSNYSVEWPV
jgi:hypothetical protein